MDVPASLAFDETLRGVAERDPSKLEPVTFHAGATELVGAAAHHWYELPNKYELYWARYHFAGACLSLLDFDCLKAKWSFLGKVVTSLEILHARHGLRAPVILEAGSGVGENFWLLDRYFRDIGSTISPRFIGVEIDGLMASCAHSLFPPSDRFVTLQGDVAEIALFADRSIDVVISHTGLNYFRQPHVILKEMIRIARHAVVTDHFAHPGPDDLFATFTSGHVFSLLSEPMFLADIATRGSLAHYDCGRGSAHLDSDERGVPRAFIERTEGVFWSQNVLIE
jgi:SAM-dependent methyltransferase